MQFTDLTNFSAIRKPISLIALLLVTWLVTACDSSNDLATEALRSPEVDPGFVVIDEGATVEPQVQSEDAEIENGGILIYATKCGIPDPAISPLVGAASLDGPMVSEIHAGLTRIRDGLNSKVEGELAETFSVDDGGKTYTFTLRNNLKFSDGSPITAYDFKWSWERALIKSRAGGAARFTFEPVQGYKRVIEGAQDELDGVQVVDEKTLIIRLSEPIAHFPMLLALPAASVVKQENVEKWGVSWTSEGAMVLETGTAVFPELPVGAGPFRLSHFDVTLDECEISRNDHYWGTPARLDGIVFFTGSGNPANPVDYSTNLFQQGEIDNIFWGSRQPKDGGKVGKRISGSAPFDLSLMLLNPTIPPFDNPHARRAVAMVSSSWLGTREDGPRILTEEMGVLSDAVSGLPFSPEAAQTELSNCDCDDAFSNRTLEYVTDLQSGFADLVFKDWSSHLGIAVQTIVDSDVPSRIWAGNTDAVSVILEIAFPDPASVLLPLLDVIPGGRNSSLVAEFRNLAETAMVEADPSRRISAWEELEQRMLASGVVIPLASVSFEPTHVQDWVYGFEYVRFGRSMFHNVWLEDSPDRTLK